MRSCARYWHPERKLCWGSTSLHRRYRDEDPDAVGNRPAPNTLATPGMTMLNLLEETFRIGVAAAMPLFVRGPRRAPTGGGAGLPHSGGIHAGQIDWLGVSIDTARQSPALSHHLGAAEADRFEIVLADRSRDQHAHDAGLVWQSFEAPAATMCPAHHLQDDPQLPEASFWQWLEHPFIGRDLVPLTPHRRDGMLPPLRRQAPTLGRSDQDVLGERPGLGRAERERLEGERLERERVIGTCAAMRTEQEWPRRICPSPGF